MHSRENRFVRLGSAAKLGLELTTIVQLTQLKVLRVGDILMRSQKQNDVALFIFDRNNIEQTVEWTSCNQSRILNLD